MSFRMFVYYCAVVGAWAGLVGWLLGRLAPSVAASDAGKYLPIVLRTSVIGLFLGWSIALALSFLDASFNHTLRKLGLVFLSVFAAGSVGVFGGLCGGFVGGSGYYFLENNVVFVIGWIVVGTLVGLSICFFQVLAGVFTGRDLGSAIKKLIKCLIGGTAGGALGGVIALVLRIVVEFIFSGRDSASLWCPTALGFVVIGGSIGLLVGLAQIILKEAWIKVEAGFRPGREMLLQKDKITIGRAEGSDIALFGDSGVEKTHANILKEGGRYYIEDLQTPGGTYINDQKVEGKAPLKAGDLIRMGKSVLLFNERTKRKD